MGSKFALAAYSAADNPAGPEPIIKVFEFSLLYLTFLITQQNLLQIT
jgi:hypothetical protein